MFRLIVLICCFICVVFCGCSSRGSRSSSCGIRNGLRGHASNSDDFSDYDYDIIPMPEGVGTIGIMDSPFYDCKSKSLYFVDLFKQNIYRYSEESNQIFYCSVSGYPQPSFIQPVRGKKDRFVVGFNASVWLLQWDGISTVCSVVEKIASPEQEQGGTHHTNSAVSGPKGGLYFGYFSSGLCGDPGDKGLYRYTRKSGTIKLPGSYKTVNSMAFDYKNNKLYVSDGCEQTLRVFKVNRKTGKIRGPWVLFNNFGLPNSAAPVGITVDRNGNLVIGSYKGGVLFFVSPSGQLLKRVTMPTIYMGAITYGGCHLDKLYVTTAQLDADVLTGTALNTTVGAPGGSLLVFYGLGRGQSHPKKPCIGC